MPSLFAVGLRACCVAVALLLATAHAAEQKSSLIGATRDQVLERLGEPRGILTAGTREVMTFDRQRVTLREGVVISVEQLSAEPAQRSASAPETVPTAPPAAETTTAPAEGATPAPTQPAGTTAAPAEASAPVAPPTTRPGREPQLSIKSVRPPGSPRPAPKEEPTPPSVVPPSSSATAQAEQANKAAAVAAAPPPPAPSLDSTLAAATTALPAMATVPASEPAEPSPEAKKAAEADAPAESAEKKGKAKTPVRRPPADVASVDAPFFTTKTIVLGLVVIGAGFAFVIWLRRQRQLELAATSVSHTPFASPTATGSSARFGTDLLSKLEWKRFEELVALYYSKTGVIAVRTKTGPSTPVNIKISWKGEPRPFAYVQCIAHPADLIDAEPLQALVAALAADDIRRGYVVTTGKFSVNARDVAEEKHLTLLPGDILLEKLNALPDTARSEILQEITKGEYQTPSCPQCDAKMVRSETGVWRCPQHPEVTVPTAR